MDWELGWAKNWELCSDREVSWELCSEVGTEDELYMYTLLRTGLLAELDALSLNRKRIWIWK